MDYMDYFIGFQFNDLDVLKRMVNVAKGFGSQYCTFSVSRSKVELIGLDISSSSSVYVYVSCEVSADTFVQLLKFNIPPSIQNTETVCFKVNTHNLAHAIECMCRKTYEHMRTNVCMKLRESGEKWILNLLREEYTDKEFNKNEKEIFVLPETFLKCEPTIGPFNVDIALPDFYKVHCVGASIKNFNERIKISANNHGELKLEAGHAMFNIVTCFNNCTNHMAVTSDINMSASTIIFCNIVISNIVVFYLLILDLVEILEDDYLKFVTINVDSTHFVKFFNVVTEEFDVNFKIVDNHALLFEADDNCLKVKLILPAKL
ncbi:21858_t:CDS:2 [Cetraspora pellucida]|uniref:21858_t:CDS:1 n=1 Tax=Cetraspora pellucida TaxID=1433469 RepID=A0A9N8YW46_9GLOM|nr:21858_t:CDS:2 [Cetraspora pellucida]